MFRPFLHKQAFRSTIRAILLSFVLFAMVVASFYNDPQVFAQDTTYTLFLPTVLQQPAPPAPSEEAQFATLLVQNPDQKHQLLRLNPLLSKVAHDKAQDMADRQYFSAKIVGTEDECHETKQHTGFGSENRSAIWRWVHRLRKSSLKLVSLSTKRTTKARRR